MSSTLGEKLRQAREERGISISEVAEQTRISPLYIKSIEEDNYKPLPGGIFNKGFLKSYARYVGFDEHEALQEYSKLVSGAEQADAEELKSYRPEVLTDDRNTASMAPTLIFAGIILAFMTGGVLIAVNYLRNQRDTAPAQVNVNADSNTAVLVPDESAKTPPSGDNPAMGSVKIEFRTASEPIWISAFVDGRNSVSTITADKPAVFEPKNSLRLSYSKSLAASARLVMNGRDISLPQAPVNPKRSTIEIELNRGNITQIWQNGTAAAISASPPSVAPSAQRPATRPPTSATNAAKQAANAPQSVPR